MLYGLQIGIYANMTEEKEADNGFSKKRYLSLERAQGCLKSYWPRWLEYRYCGDMEDMARYYVEEIGSLGEISSHLQNYIDYQTLGRDMDLEGNFLVTSYGVLEYLS